MQGRIFAGFLLCSLFIVVGGEAQGPANKENPVWTLDFIKVKPEKFGLAMGVLDDSWMRVREEAKRQGAVLNYHRITDTMLTTPRSKPGDPATVVLMTEYKNVAAYMGREKLFASIRERLPSTTPGVLRQQPEDLYETVDTQLFMEVPNADTRLKLLARQ